jgi:hypothetical protein
VIGARLLLALARLQPSLKVWEYTEEVQVRCAFVCSRVRAAHDACLLPCVRTRVRTRAPVHARVPYTQRSRPPRLHRAHVRLRAPVHVCCLHARGTLPPLQLLLVGTAFLVLAACNFFNTVSTMRAKRARSKGPRAPVGSPRLGAQGSAAFFAADPPPPLPGTTGDAGGKKEQ